jgi:tetratricopeptide (TPR) repeat protein
MAKKQTEQHKHELIENPQALADKLQGAETWVERHPKTVIGVSLIIALVVGGYFAFQYYKDNQEQEAQKEMFQAVRYFEADSLELALNGDGNNLGFIAITDDYGFTKAGKLANFYAGAIYLKQAKYEVARLYLEDFNSDDILIQARAYSLIGDTYMEEGSFEDAAKFYAKAADHKPNKYFTPVYLMKAALAYEKSNQKEKAIDAYNEVISKYLDSPEVNAAKKYKAKLEGVS